MFHQYYSTLLILRHYQGSQHPLAQANGQDNGPGPMILSALRKLKLGGTGRSVTFHGGPVPLDAGKWEGFAARVSGVALLLSV